MELPYRAVKSNIADYLDSIVQIEQRPGLRFVSEVLELRGYSPEADRYDLNPVFTEDSWQANHSYYDGIEREAHLDWGHEDEIAFQARHESERQDCAIIRQEIDRGVPDPEIEEHLELASDFVRLNPGADARAYGTLGPQEFHGCLALLVNQHSASAAEMVAGFATENRLATIVGITRPGRLLSGASFKVGHGYVLGLPGAAYLTWQGVILEGKGIVPDEEVGTSRDLLKQGRDSQLERAIEVAERL